MLKKNAYKRIIVASLLLLAIICIVKFPSSNDQFMTSTDYIEAIKMPLYIIDNNDYVSRISVLKTTDDVMENITYIINTLTENTTESTYISNSFSPIIPSGTVVRTIFLENGLLKINFSSEFLNISASYEVKLIEALVFSLCEFSEVDEIMIFVEGEHLIKLPNSNQSLPITLDKSYGINKIYDINTLKNSSSTVSYYLGFDGFDTYYIPITKYENIDSEKIEVIIKNLKSSPINQTNLISYLKASASLEYYEILENSVMLSFNNELLADLNDFQILEEVRYSIFLSIRDTYNISSVIFESTNEISVALYSD